MKKETTVAALTVKAVEMLASVVAVAIADGNGNGSLNRVSNGSGGVSGCGSGRQQETVGADNNQQNVAAVVAETAVVAAAIVAVWLQRQAGAAAWQK